MIFLLKKFILEYKKQKQSLLKEIEFNQKLESFFPFFQKEEEFLNLNIKNFLSFLRDNNFSFYPYEKLETTLSYIQVNNCFLDPNCQTFFTYPKIKTDKQRAYENFSCARAGNVVS